MKKILLGLLVCLLLVSCASGAEVAVSEPLIMHVINPGIYAPITDVTVVADGLLAVQEGGANALTYISPDKSSYLMAWQYQNDVVASTFYNAQGNIEQFDKYSTYQTFQDLIRVLQNEGWTPSPETVPPAIASFLKFLSSAVEFTSSINVSIFVVPGVVLDTIELPSNYAGDI